MSEQLDKDPEDDSGDLDTPVEDAITLDEGDDMLEDEDEDEEDLDDIDFGDEDDDKDEDDGDILS